MPKPKQASASARKPRTWLWLAGAAAAVVAVLAVILATTGGGGSAQPDDPQQVALGKAVYGRECAKCHGKNLEGQPNWNVRKPNGLLPAPPQDATGHTWHHTDEVLFGIVKKGTAAFAPPGYQTEMDGFADKLSDKEIWAVLSYIEASWPESIRMMRMQHGGKH